VLGCFGRGLSRSGCVGRCGDGRGSSSSSSSGSGLWIRRHLRSKSKKDGLFLKMESVVGFRFESIDDPGGNQDCGCRKGNGNGNGGGPRIELMTT
jgi:hypothetical protein